MLLNRLTVSVFNIRITAKFTELSYSSSLPLCAFRMMFLFFHVAAFGCSPFPPLTPHLLHSCLALLPYWLLFTFYWPFWSCPTRAATTSTATQAATLAVSAEFSNEPLLDCSLSPSIALPPSLSYKSTY